jgi:hypothetical protein
MSKADSGCPCPRCKMQRAYRSRALNLKERAVKTAGARKMRCHECGFSFFQLGSSVLVMKDVERVARKVAGYFAAVLAVALCLFVIRWVVLRMGESSSPESSYPVYRELPHGPTRV